MLKLFKLIFITFTISLSSYSQVVNSNWQWLHPKPQGSILRWCKMWDNNTWYMAGSHGVFLKTTNGGVNWIVNSKSSRLVNNVQFGDITSGYFFDQNTGIVVGQLGSIMKTTNAGNSFDSIPQFYYRNIHWFKIRFLNNSTGYIAGQMGNGGKLAKTTNGGNSWQFVETVIPLRFFDIALVNDSLLMLCDVAGQIARSSDAGLNWDLISTGSNSTLHRISFVNNDTGFVCGENGTVKLTTNSGLNWLNVNNGLPLSLYTDIDFKIVGQNLETYLTGNPHYVYKTTNLGNTWDTIGIWTEGEFDYGVDYIYYNTELGNGDTLLSVGTFGLIKKRNNSSEIILFSDFVKFGRFAGIYDIWAGSGSSNIWAVGRPSLNGITFDQVIYSSNNGLNWQIQDCGSTSELYTSIQMFNSSTGYIAGSAGTIRKTTNGGLNWLLISSPTSSHIHKIEFVNNSTGWIFGGITEVNSTVFKTTNGGLSWIEQTATGFPWEILSADMVDENTGWIVGRVGKVAKTTNGGQEWIQQNPNINMIAPWLTEIKMLDANTGYFGGYRTLRKTTNGGNVWDSVPLPFAFSLDFQVNGLDFINSDYGIINCYDLSLKTTNGGVSWLIEDLLTNVQNTSTEGFRRVKMISEDTAYIGSMFGGVLKYSGHSPIGITEWQNTIPRDFVLFQNYPNPFNPNTTIKFAIPRQSKVILKVFDITGREIKTIINMELNAGTVTHQFDGSELASGIYFYSLYIDSDLADTKKMILIK